MTGQGPDLLWRTLCVVLAELPETAILRMSPPMNADPLRSYLDALSHRELVELLLECADADERLAARLQLRAAGRQPQLAKDLRDAIDDAFTTDGYVHYREMYEWSTGLYEVVTVLKNLLDDGHPVLVAELALHAIDRADRALQYVDDSDGTMSDVADQLATLHLDACTAAPPEPEELAALLLDRELHDGDLAPFHAALDSYTDILGPTGMSEYRRLATQRWDAVTSATGHPYTVAVARIMERLADLDGDVDAAVAIMARDLSSAYRYLRIAERLQAADRHGDANRWAEQGLATFGTADPRLVDLVVAEYRRTGRDAEAVDLAERAFLDQPSLAGYGRLVDVAGEEPGWGARRRRVLLSITGELSVRAKGQRWSHARDGSLLVEIHLLDDEPDLAWTAAQAYGCSRPLWRRLAALREVDHPDDAIAIWKDEVERAISAKNNRSYAEAVMTMAEIRRLMAGADGEFAAYVAGIVKAHKPKRNLMKLVQQQGW